MPDLILYSLCIISSHFSVRSDYGLGQIYLELGSHCALMSYLNLSTPGLGRIRLWEKFPDHPSRWQALGTQVRLCNSHNLIYFFPSLNSSLTTLTFTPSHFPHDAIIPVFSSVPAIMTVTLLYVVYMLWLYYLPRVTDATFTLCIHDIFINFSTVLDHSWVRGWSVSLRSRQHLINTPYVQT